MNYISNLLIKSIELLASNSDTQRKYLRDLGTFPSTDELALEFDDAYKPFIGQQGYDPTEIIAINLSKIDSLLDSYSKMEDKTIWLETSLDSNLWTAVRELAASIHVDPNLQSQN